MKPANPFGALIPSRKSRICNESGPHAAHAAPSTISTKHSVPGAFLMRAGLPLSTDVLRLDPVSETERILTGIRNIVFRQLNRKGAVVELSGELVSSLVAFLGARSL